MLKKRILIVFCIAAFLGGCACLFVEPKSENAVKVFAESMSKLTLMTSAEESEINLVNDKIELNTVINSLNGIVDEKKTCDKSAPTIKLIESEVELLGLWIDRIDTGKTKKVKIFLDERKSDIIQFLQNLIDNENEK